MAKGIPKAALRAESCGRAVLQPAKDQSGGCGWFRGVESRPGPSSRMPRIRRVALTVLQKVARDIRPMQILPSCTAVVLTKTSFSGCVAGNIFSRTAPVHALDYNRSNDERTATFGNRPGA